MGKLNIEVSLSRLLTGLWPKEVHRKAVATDQIFPLLKAEAEKAGVALEGEPEFINLVLSFALVGFEAKDGGWKAVFQPYILVCALMYGRHCVRGFEASIAEGPLKAVAHYYDVPDEVDVDIPRVEELPLLKENMFGYIIDTGETCWRLAK